MNQTLSQALLLNLYRGIAHLFSILELQTLCFELGIDYEDIPGSTRESKARELVLYCRRRSQLPQLLAYCVQQRPDYQWPAGLDDVANPATPTAADQKAEGVHQTVILFLSANPQDMPTLAIDQEVRAIDQALRQGDYRDHFVLHQQWAVQVADLQGHLLRYRPQILHFSGHGNRANQLLLRDPNGNRHPVTPAALAHVFAAIDDTVRCVVLNACHSMEQAAAIARHVECVVAMSAAITDEGAIDFAVGFYQALGYGKSVQSAFALGLSQIALDGLDETAVPQLIATGDKAAGLHFAHP